LSDISSPATSRPGPYFSRWGPESGPILGRDDPAAIGVHDSPDNPMPIGMALPRGLVEHRRGPAKVFRILIRGVEIDGLWLCVGRRFVPLGDAAELLP
jgi:hypothetical protein